MSTQYRLVQSGKTASGGCSAGKGSSEPVAPRTDLEKGVFILMSRPDDETVNTSETSVYFHESALSNIPEYYHFFSSE
jgi:hypothetical protein